MPNFQQSVNQTIGTVGVLAGLSGAAQAGREKRNLNKRQKVLDKQNQLVTQDTKEKFTPDAKGNITIDPQTKSELEQTNKELMRQNQEQEDISRKRFDLKPTLKNYQRWQSDAAINQNIKKQEQAMADMESKKEAKKALRRNFMDYISKMPMLGETIGSIDARNPGFAKQIASQYDRNARRRMMNKMDREARDGKQ